LGYQPKDPNEPEIKPMSGTEVFQLGFIIGFALGFLVAYIIA